MPVATEPARRVPAEVQDIEGERYVLALEEAARGLLDAVQVRRGDGEVMDDRCLACEDSGIHIGDEPSCGCGCHPARRLLATVCEG